MSGIAQGWDVSRDFHWMDQEDHFCKMYNSVEKAWVGDMGIGWSEMYPYIFYETYTKHNSQKDFFIYVLKVPYALYIDSFFDKKWFIYYLISDIYISTQHVPDLYHSLWHLGESVYRVWLPGLSPMGKIHTRNQSWNQGWISWRRGHNNIPACILLLYNRPKHCCAYISLR